MTTMKVMMRLCYFYTKRGYKSTKLILLSSYLLEMLCFTISIVQKHDLNTSTIFINGTLFILWYTLLSQERQNDQ